MTSDEVIRVYQSALAKQKPVKASTFISAEKYSRGVGNALSTAVTKALEGLEDISETDAADLLKAVLNMSYNDTLAFAKQVQTLLNRNAGISLKAAEVQLDTERIGNYIQKLASDYLENTGFLSGTDACRNFTRSAVTATIEENARVQKEAGLESIIERTSGGGCCAWCDSKEGRYIYGEQPDGFFQVHKDCTCEIDFKPAKRTWERITYETGEDGKLHKITTRV